MGLKYTWDTNTVIYYLQNGLPPAGEELIDHILDSHQPVISVITEMELLCYRSASANEITLLSTFISNSAIYPLDEPVKLKAIEIRKSYRLKLPDAIIAATALVNNYILISRNGADFNKITELKIIDPFNFSDDFII